MEQDNFGTYELPMSQLTFNKPAEDISEKEKFAEKGEWFARMARWTMWNFYNPFESQFYNPIKNDTTVYGRWSNEMLENFAYYYGRQQNKTYAYTEQIDQNNTIQAVYIPDQKIRQLVDHAVGISRKMIDPIPKSFSATILSENFLKEHNDLRRKLEIKKALASLINDQAGVTFAPNGIDEVDEDTDIDSVMEEFMENQTIDFVRTAQGLYYNNSLNTKLEQSALHELVGNVSTFLVDVDENNETKIEFYPCYNSIVDTRATDDYLNTAMCSGGVKWLTAAEITDKYGKWLDEDQRNFINRLSEKTYKNWQECYNFYNRGFGEPSSMINWCENGKVSVATVYWIGKKDIPYRVKDTKFGSKLQWIDSSKDYAVMEGGKPKYDEKGKIVTQKGEDIRGEGSGWFVHKCTLIGNCIAVDYGYTKVQVRPQGKKQKPLLPTVQFVHRMTMGYARSLVSRLRQFAEERGMLKLKIQELVGKDLGMVYLFWAHKMALTDQSTENIYKDFRSMNFSLINTNGEDNGEQSGKITAEALNLSLQSSVMSYIQLVRECAIEMEGIVNMPAIALGQQTDVVGKGVQSTTINQASLGQLSLYSGLAEHWRQLIQYALNVEKTVNAGKEKMVRTGANEAYLVNIAKNLKWEEIGLQIEFGNPNDEIIKKTLLDGLFAFNQNGGTVEAAEALLTTVKLMNFNSTVEGEEHLENFVEKKKKEAIQNAQAQQQSEIQGQAALQAQIQTFQAQMKEMELLIKSSDTRYVADVASLTKLVTDMEKNNTQMSQLLMQQMAEQPPTTPLEAGIQAQQQPAQNAQ